MDVLMPQLGETVAEGKITKWFKAAGEAVKPGDNLFEIETDKVSMEVPSITTGVLSEIRIPAGEVAPVGAVVAVIADGAGAAVSAPVQPAPTVSAPRREVSPPLIPAQAGIQTLGPRVRGDERKRCRV
jgi:pyruvate/2-oxoglutarate dehydrogenase complex dihydrolipoamide acyltransferase (E2) component